MVHDKGWVLPFVLPFEAVVQACCNPPSRPPGPRRLRHHRPPHRRHHQLAVIAAAAAVGCPRRRRLLQTWVGFGAGTEAAEVDAASRQLTAAPRSTVGRQPAPPPTAAAEVACPQQLCCAQRFRQPRQPRLHGGLQGRLRRRGALRVVAARRQKATAATMTARPLSSNTMSAYPPPSSRSPVASAAKAAAAAFQWASSMAKGVLASECTGQGPGRSRGCRSRRALRRPRRWCSCQCRCI